MRAVGADESKPLLVDLKDANHDLPSLAKALSRACLRTFLLFLTILRGRGRLERVEELIFLGNHAYEVRLTSNQRLPVGRTRYAELQRRLGLEAEPRS